ncbi:2-oxo acid dehydrogenase subunit E2 [Haloarcula salinisoli]|uniref:2-oxo acid dehydrogenase subunit E2 n=1 Tax=Haloarcula salinisoli TaxID=2487746 RepID=A0A8J7YL77_9EURY|nr:2-oxo acid dehydrogenase subunit E2 [Halomicroarcula salinisoli]MBX0286497.1 2-oxo acid dehydrogenase subunit E2 [Halomicroarcula salinisoli]MBX0303846.1 2-oxo acid dehydrogenase subunit E2 [Halomicroarcula salinisoli]
MFEFELPDLGEGVAEGEVLAWHVAVGDAVAEDQVLAEVETDKAAVDVPSPVDGVVRELHAEVGDIVATGEVLVSIEEGVEAESAETAEGGGEAAGSEAASDETAADSRAFAPPSVRRLAREQGVDITAVEGSGPSGRITEADVEAAASEAADDDDGPTSVVSQVDEGERDGPTSVVSKVSDDEDDDSGPTSVVSKVSDDDGPTRVISPVEDDGDTETTVVDLRDDGPAVKSAVRRATSDPMAERRDHTLATPATRRLARELGVDIDAVPTDETREGEPYVDAAAVRAVASEARSASDSANGETVSEREEVSGEITDEDVREVAQRVVSELQETAAEVGAEPTPVEASDADRREPYRGVRRSIGEQMARSRREVPHATHHDKVAVPGLVEARERLQPLAEKEGVELTYTPLVLKCVAAALEEHPILATQLDTEAEEIVYRSDRDIGVATATDHGLVVPVVEDVDEKGLLELAADTSELVSRARNRDIDREEMQGGVFTVTNFGAIGGEYADPVINVPETAILGVGALKERPVARDGEVVAEPTLTLSLAIDHRVIDGADAARFMNTLKEYLADPTRLLA